MDNHYSGIIAGYAVATAVVWLLYFLARPVVAGSAALSFQRPWLEIGLVLVAAALTIGVGQLYVRHMLLPDEGVALRSANQALIFAPLLLLVFVRAPGAAGGGMPFGSAILGLLVGIIVAVGATLLYALVRGFAPQDVSASVLQIDNIPHAAQVLFEDIAIAALLLRLGAAISTKWAVVLVAALFAAGHIPAMIANGAQLTELSSLLLDTGIGVIVAGAVLTTRSIWWLWPLHTAMDLTQFYTPS